MYPHKSDYCDFCANKHEEINRQQTTLNRIRQTGSCSEENQKAIEEEIERLEDLLKRHRAEATSALKHYHEVIERCQTQWKKIVEFESKAERTESEEQELRGLKEGFILVLSADYQMEKLLPSWCKSPQPSSTYYFQKLSCDILGVIDHREGSASTYIFDERMGPKNTDHTISYLLHYLRSDRIPSWIKRIHLFMDNAGSTNKNQFFMGAAMEIVQEDILTFFRISFMVAGHTKFDPDWLFSSIAKVFNAADTFNLTQLTKLISKHAFVTLDNGKIVRTWRLLLSDKYSNLPGIRNLHDFLVVKHPITKSAVMKVRENCFEGTFEDTPMKVTRQECVLPTPTHSYAMQNRLRSLTDSKLKDLHNMYSKYIAPDMWPDFIQQ